MHRQLHGHRCFRALWAIQVPSLLLGAAIFGSHSPKDKRGWTLNSAGYLLGPRKSIQNLVSTPELAPLPFLVFSISSPFPFNSISSLSVHAAQRADDHILQILMDFLSYLNLQGEDRLQLLWEENGMCMCLFGQNRMGNLDFSMKTGCRKFSNYL
uniref:Galanin domain-containing protein n=1 Tax=Varanus komodoensis TaxID=61221 RepID=A0A8D2LL11_VARKO